MTSNVGSELLRRKDIGFDKGAVKTKDEGKIDFEKRIFGLLKDAFKPEFLNRIDEIIIFSNLSKEDILEICRRLVAKTKKLLFEQGIGLNVDEKGIKYLAEHGYSEEYGARPLRRFIQKELDNVLSEKIITGELTATDEVRITTQNDGLKMSIISPAKVEAK